MTTSRSIYAERLRELSDLAFADHAAFAHRGKWGELFRQRIGAEFDGRLIFEIGCFDAAYLARIAAKHPSTAFVGLDWKCKPLYDGARHLTEAGLRNIILLRGRGQDLRQIFADEEVDEMWVFHPDPCDKAAELKNRLIAEPFLLDAHTVLRRAGSILAIKTDHPGYYQWMLGLLGLPLPPHLDMSTGSNSAAPKVRVRDLMIPQQIPKRSDAILQRFDTTSHSPDFWNDAAALAHTASRLFAGELTAFEQRFVRTRFPIYYVELSNRATRRA